VNEHLLARAYDRDGNEWRMYGPPLSVSTVLAERATADRFYQGLLGKWPTAKDKGGYLLTPPEYRIVRVGPAVEAA